MIDKRQDYVTLLELFAQTVESQAGKQIPKDTGWLAYIESISAKLFFHLGSIFYLSEGTSLPELGGKKIGYVDFASIALLARGAFETYLTFYYIFVDPKTSEETLYRYRLWRLGGLLDRQRFTPITTLGKEKLQSEAREIETLRSLIVSDPIYLRLNNDRQKDSRSGKWRFGNSWVQLAEIAGSETTYFKSLYTYLSSYAHSSYLSVLQISQADTQNTQRMLSEMSLTVGLTLLSNFIFAYSRIFPAAKAVVDSDVDGKKVAEKWYFNNDEVARFYKE